MIVSHADGDHAGGVAGLEAQHRVAHYLGPQAALPGAGGEPCTVGRQWRRDGVAFRLLWPPDDARGLSDNDRSCVLEVTAGDHRLLLTGDLGKMARAPACWAELAAPVSLLLAGHHGSATSSGLGAGGRRLTPRHVVFSVARHNPSRPPGSSRWSGASGAPAACQWSTGLDGAVTFRLGGDELPIPEAARPGVRPGVDCGHLALESP